MVRVSHHPNTHSCAGFVLEFGRHLVPHRRNLIAHQNVIGLKRLPPFVQRFQLGMKLYPLLLQRFEFGNLLLERRADTSLLACGLVHRGQPRQITGMTRVDLRNTLARLRHYALGFANPGLDHGEVLLDKCH